MSLRPTHQGYAYQDLMTGIALVDLMLGVAERITVDTKGFEGDRFDDLTIQRRRESRTRIQIKHTAAERELSKGTFSGDGRSLRIDRLFGSLLSDVDDHPDTTYRVVVRDGDPDPDLATVLKPCGDEEDPGDPLPGVVTRRFRFDPKALQDNEPWKSLLGNLEPARVEMACDRLTIDTSAPASSLNLAKPGTAERALLRRVVEELGAERPPNGHIRAEHAALALLSAATAARAVDGHVDLDSVVPRVGLTTDFGAVSEGHPVEPALEVARPETATGVGDQVDSAAAAGGWVLVTGGPGVGKSWLCEQIADRYRQADWIVARHHCWLGATDVNRDERVLTEVVVGSLLGQLEDAAPGSTTSLRPRFASTIEALNAVIRACREAEPDRRVLLIVDGLDHVDRVLGRNTAHAVEPSQALVDALSTLDLPPGSCVVIASQPGSHLASVERRDAQAVDVPPMSWNEVAALAMKHGLLDWMEEDETVDEVDDARAIIDLVLSRSGGNALYATYLARHACRTSPLSAERRPTSTASELLLQLEEVPVGAADLEAYYEHLLRGLTADTTLAIAILALCDFAVSAEELREIVPAAAPLLGTALARLAPVLNSQPGVGGLRIHHESFGRHVLRDADPQWIRDILASASGWLSTRGFFLDSRAYRHQPTLLAQLGRYDELKELLQSGFVAKSIQALHPPEAILRVVGVISNEAAERLDWPTLIQCVETRKSIDTYEAESLVDSIVEYADVVVAAVGADVVSERLVYEGRPTFPARWGLRLCAALDKAGASAPWKVYLKAHDVESRHDNTSYGQHAEATLQLALQLGALRLREQRGDIASDLTERVAEFLELDHHASLEDLVAVFAVGLPAGLVREVPPEMKDPAKAARTYLALADLASDGMLGLPEPTELARAAWTLAPKVGVDKLLAHGLAATDVLRGLEITDLNEDLQDATQAVLGGGTMREASVRRWLSLLKLAHQVDRTMPLRLAAHLTDAGFYPAWLRYAIATVGLADDVREGTTSAHDASTAVRVALGELASHAEPFTGDPRACDLYSIHFLIHEVFERSLSVVQESDLAEVLDHLIGIGDGTTTTTNFGLPENGPLTTNDLLEVLSRVSDRIGVSAVHDVLNTIRARRSDTYTQYAITADFELATAKICVTAGAHQDVDDCWRRASRLLASYGGHKDPTISEIVDSVLDIATVDVGKARTCLSTLLDPVYLVRQHTNGRGTSHFVDRWWEVATSVDPIAVAASAAQLQLENVGFEDSRVYTAHSHALEAHVADCDPIVMAALRLTVGTGWRRPSTDHQLLTRLEAVQGHDPAIDVLLEVVANNIARSYDDQPMQYSSGQPKSVASQELIDTVVRLGGARFSMRDPRPDEKPSERWNSSPRPKALKQQHHLSRSLRPSIPEGRQGAIAAARSFDSQRFADAADGQWDFDAISNAVGWRVLETTLDDGADAGITLVDLIAREISIYSENELFAALGEGLAARTGPESGSVRSVASYCLTLAFVRIRGGGGWRAFAGRERVDLWLAAFELDPVMAERTLASAVAERVESAVQGMYGITQAVIAALASTRGEVAIECWQTASSVIRDRLPGEAELDGHSYRPHAIPTSPGELDAALATLALSAISRPLREDLRQSLLTARLLIIARPKLAQAALGHVLQGSLDAGRVTWLLEVLWTSLPVGGLADEMALCLTQLAACDLLSVRALAAEILEVHGQVVPDPPATSPPGSVVAALRNLSAEAD